MTEDSRDIRGWAQDYADRLLVEELRRRADRLTREALPQLVADLDPKPDLRDAA